MFEHDEVPVEQVGEQCARWIGALSSTADPDQIALGYALRNHLSAILTGAVGRLDAEGSYATDGAVTASSWLRNRVHLDSAEASRTVRTARRLRQWPCTEAAWNAGRLTAGQVRAIVDTIGANEALADVFAIDEAELVPTISGYSVRHVTMLMHRWAQVAKRTIGDDADPDTSAQALHLSSHLDGEWRIDGNLDPETGNLVNTALDMAIGELPDPDPDDERHVLMSQHRAEALAHICRFFLDHRLSVQKAPRNRPHVNVIVDLPFLLGHTGRAETIDGLALPESAIRQLLCDANVHRIITDGPSVVLDQGRGTRTCTPEQWNALVARDRFCAWPSGCDVPASRCQAHHEPAWIDGGTTDIAAMRLLCHGHHRLRHQPGWTAKILPDATYEAVSPAGRTFTSRQQC